MMSGSCRSHQLFVLGGLGLFLWQALTSLCVAASGPSSGGAVASLNLDLLAEFVTVDYLWDGNHSRQLYEQSGQFVVANNIITGVKVSKSGDIFVCVPRWMSGVPSSLNKLVANPNGPGYVLAPWPSWEFNALNSTGSLRYAQSMIIDSNNLMWIPDVGRINFFDSDSSLITNGPAALFVVNITDGVVLSTYYFPEEVVPFNNSFINDIVLDEVNGYAYFSNTYGNGGIVVYDINRNISHMFTAQCTERNSSYDFCVNEICYGTDGIGDSPSDGIALSSDNKFLYFSSVQGPTLYMIETVYLWNFDMSNANFESKVVLLGQKAGCSDGLLFLGTSLFYGDITTSQLGVVNNIEVNNQSPNSIVAIKIVRLVSPSAAPISGIDWFAADPHDVSAFYFTSNRLNLYFAATMDFTGQSGANFRIYHASINYSSSDNNDGPYLWAAVGTAILIAVALTAFLVIYRWRTGHQCWKRRRPSTDIHKGLISVKPSLTEL
jgi:hypothetical protein